MTQNQMTNKEEVKSENVDIENTKSTNLVENKPKGKHLFQKGHPKMGGKKKGDKNKATIEKELARKEMENSILREIRELIDAQKQLAKGTSYLYKIITHKDGKKEHILVDDPYEIKDYLDELEGEDGTLPYNNDYYYIATKEPNNQALDSLLNRVFGKPKETHAFEPGEGGMMGVIFLPRRKQDEDKQLNEPNGKLEAPITPGNSS